jgi:Protein of unknown function (DUF3225)
MGATAPTNLTGRAIAVEQRRGDDEQALVNNDVGMLDALFHNDARTIRYGIAENLYGHAEVARMPTPPRP